MPSLLFHISKVHLSLSMQLISIFICFLPLTTFSAFTVPWNSGILTNPFRLYLYRVHPSLTSCADIHGTPETTFIVERKCPHPLKLQLRQILKLVRRENQNPPPARYRNSISMDQEIGKAQCRCCKDEQGIPRSQ